MSQFPEIASNLSTANFRASVLTQLANGIQVLNDAGNPFPISGTVEVTNDVGNPLPISGNVEVTNDIGNPLPISGNVEVTNDIGNPLPISGTVEVTNDVGNPLPINGTVEVTNDVGNPLPINGTVEVTNDVGNPLPINGTVEVTNDVGNPLPISGNVNSDVSGTTGTLAESSTYTITTTNYSTLGFQAVRSGTISAGTVTIYGSVDGITFTVPTTYVALTTGGSSTTFAATNAITAGQINCVGLKAIRFVSSAFTGGGSLGFTTNLSYNTATVMLDNSVPVGSNLIGKINPTDGNGNLITIKAASTASSATDTSTVVALSPNSPLPVGSNAIGTVTAQPVSGSLTMSNSSVSTASALMLAASSATKTLTIQNTSANTLYVSTSNPATSVNGIVIGTGIGYQFPYIPTNALYSLGSAAGTTYTLWYA